MLHQCAAERAADMPSYATLEDGPLKKTSCYMGAMGEALLETMQTAKALEARAPAWRSAPKPTGSRLKTASMGNAWVTLRTS